MRKTAFFILFFLIMASTVIAGEEEALVLTLIDGTEVEFVLTEKPQLAFPETSLQVTSGSTEVSYPLYYVYNLTFNEAVGIKSPVVQEKKHVTMDFTSQDAVIFTGDIAGRKIYVIDLDGKRHSVRSNSDGSTATVDLTGLTTGQYIINIEGLESFKIQKR